MYVVFIISSIFSRPTKPKRPTQSFWVCSSLHVEKTHEFSHPDPLRYFTATRENQTNFWKMFFLIHLGSIEACKCFIYTPVVKHSWLENPPFSLRNYIFNPGSCSIASHVRLPGWVSNNGFTVQHRRRFWSPPRGEAALIIAKEPWGLGGMAFRERFPLHVYTHTVYIPPKIKMTGRKIHHELWMKMYLLLKMFFFKCHVWGCVYIYAYMYIHIYMSTLILYILILAYILYVYMYTHHLGSRWLKCSAPFNFLKC